eukprot:943352-Amphidinium_carterae.1
MVIRAGDLLHKRTLCSSVTADMAVCALVCQNLRHTTSQLTPSLPPLGHAQTVEVTQHLGPLWELAGCESKHKSRSPIAIRARKTVGFQRRCSFGKNMALISKLSTLSTKCTNSGATVDSVQEIESKRPFGILQSVWIKKHNSYSRAMRC